MTRMELDEAIWQLHVPMLRLAQSILRHPQNAEDAVSTAVIAAYRKLSTLRNDASLKPWMMRITARCCYDLIRQGKRETPLPDPAGQEVILFEEPLEGSLYGLLSRLPKGQMQVLVLYYYEGFSAGEIAHILGLTRPTVSMRMSRGRAQLKAWLEEEKDESNL